MVHFASSVQLSTAKRHLPPGEVRRWWSGASASLDLAPSSAVRALAVILLEIIHHLAISRYFRVKNKQFMNMNGPPFYVTYYDHMQGRRWSRVVGRSECDVLIWRHVYVCSVMWCTNIVQILLQLCSSYPISPIGPVYRRLARASSNTGVLLKIWKYGKSSLNQFKWRIWSKYSFLELCTILF